MACARGAVRLELRGDGQCGQRGRCTPAPLWNDTASAWLTDMGALLALALVYALLTWRRLAKMGPAKRR
jgi:hypothetical protein